MMAFGNLNFVWGIKPEFLTAEIIDLPADTIKVRRRMRSRNVLHLFIKTKDAIYDYVPEMHEGKLKIGMLKGVNSL